MARGRKPKDEGGTATLEPVPGTKPGEQGELFECSAKNAKKFNALCEDVYAARRAKAKAKEKEEQALDAIRVLAENDSEVHPDEDGSMHFTADGQIITIAARDKSVSIRPVSKPPTPSKRGKSESPD